MASEGRLGRGNIEEREEEEEDGWRPQRVRTALGHTRLGVVSVAAGGLHTLFQTQEGQLFSCGSGASGQLGLGDTLDRCMLTHVPLPEQARCISAGLEHSLVASSRGRVYAFGEGSDHKLGLGTGTEEDQCSPQEAQIPVGAHAVAVAAGGAHSLVLTEEELCGGLGVTPIIK